MDILNKYNFRYFSFKKMKREKDKFEINKMN